MTAIPIRPATDADLPWMLALNKVHEEALSPLDGDGMRALVGAAALALVVDGERGFVVCFDQDAAYDSPNFLWFRDRYPRFLYVDRIVVDAEKPGKGVGTALYAEVGAETARRGFPVLCAEVNTRPANPASIRFHEKAGFETVGEAELPDRGKAVRYFARHSVGADLA